MENGHPFFIFYFQLEMEKWEMGGHFPLFIFTSALA